MSKSKELSEMVAKLCSTVDQESVHVPAGFLRELEMELAVLRSSQSEERREAAMQSLHGVTRDKEDAERRLAICRSELGRQREDFLEETSRLKAQIASLEEDLVTVQQERDALLRPTILVGDQR